MSQRSGSRLLFACGVLAVLCAGWAQTAPLREIHGHVRLSETGMPIAGVTIAIEELRSSWVPGHLPHVKELVRTRTAADGAFSLVLPKAKHMMIRIVEERCKWRGRRMRLDMVDLNAPLEYSLNEWACETPPG